MNTVLEAIQIYKRFFISTIHARSVTTPSEENRNRHLLLITAIEVDDWKLVSDIITDEWYRKPFGGVIYCLETYSDIDRSTWLQICGLFEDGKLV